MDYGNRKPHIRSPEDLTILRCYCGWTSDELTVEQIQDRGIPWYCNVCGKQHLRWITFAPHERAEAYAAFGIRNESETKHE